MNSFSEINYFDFVARRKQEIVAEIKGKGKEYQRIPVRGG